MRCEFINQQRKSYPVSVLCRICKVSRSGYYEYIHRQESQRQKNNRRLLTQITAVFAQSRKTYGALRVQRELKARGVCCGKNRVARLMRQAGLKSVHRKKFRVLTTDSKHTLPISMNILEQNFEASAPNEKWGCDLTYIPTEQGWLYLAVVLDFYSRKIKGWATSCTLHASVCSDALKMALLRAHPPAKLIHHSDRGVQYACGEYTSLLKKHHFIQSMSRRGNCYDNAMVESFMHTLKVECVYQRRYLTRQEAHKDIGDYIEHFYNQRRRHSSLDYCSPVEYEKNNRFA